MGNSLVVLFVLTLFFFSCERQRGIERLDPSLDYSVNYPDDYSSNYSEDSNGELEQESSDQRIDNPCFEGDLDCLPERGKNRRDAASEDLEEEEETEENENENENE